MSMPSICVCQPRGGGGVIEKGWYTAMCIMSAELSMHPMPGARIEWTPTPSRPSPSKDRRKEGKKERETQTRPLTIFANPLRSRRESCRQQTDKETG